MPYCSIDQSFLSIRSLFCYVWVASLLTRTQAATVNITIDDASSAFSYSPPNKWNIGQTCASQCSAHPIPADTYGGTWHDGTHYSTGTTGALKAEVNFTGTTVTVYGIKGYGSQAATDLEFQIDGHQVGRYSQPDTVGQGFVYHFPFFSTQGLSNAQHTLTILNGANNDTSVSLLLLDYIVYSQEDQSTTSVAAPNPTSGNSSTTTSSSSNQHPSVSNQASITIASTQATGFESKSSSSVGEANLVPATASLTTISSTTTVTGLPAIANLETNHSNTATILGGVIGALAGTFLILILIILWRKSKKKSSSLLYRNTRVRNFQTKYPFIQPFRVESPVSPSAMSRRTMGMDVKSPLPENRSPVSTDVQSRMVNTAITLAAEVQRLRGENDRLRQSGQMAEVPPSYQQSNTHVEVDPGDSLDGFDSPV